MIDTALQAAEILKEQDDILILVHAHPDGDTLGCGYSLCRALISLGKRAAVSCSDAIPPKYAYLSKGIEHYDFEPGTWNTYDTGKNVQSRRAYNY